MTLETGGTEKLDIGTVIQTTFGVIRRNFVSFGLISLLFAGIPALIIGLAAPRGSAEAFTNPGATGTILLGVLVSIVATAVLQGALVHMTAADLSGRSVSASAGITTGVRNFLPLLGIGLLMGLGIAVGILFLAVPGIILAIMWSVTVPASIVERLTITSAFGRSRNLTRNNRWRILGLTLVMVIAIVVIEVILGAIFGGLSVIGQGSPIGALGQAIGSVLSGMIGASGVAVLYAELRRIKDGVGINDLAAVFD